MTAGDTATPIFDTVVSEISRRADPGPEPEPEPEPEPAVAEEPGGG